MPVSGLVLTLERDASLRSVVLDVLEADGRVTAGEPIEESFLLPVVTETATMDEHQALWNELSALDGVLMIRLAFHDFSDVEEPCSHDWRKKKEEDDSGPT